MDRLREVAAKIIADYKEHYDFPWQGESHMEDCIMTNLQSLSQEAVRDEVLMLLEEYDSREPSCPKEVAADRLIGSLREALKREPNAAVRVERAQCTLCSSEPSPGFYTGCMIQDGAAKQTGWNCDGKGNLTRFPAPAAPDVSKTVQNLQDIAFALDKQGSQSGAVVCRQAAALLAKLGQGWITEPVAWRREWDGDISDVGHMIYVDDPHDRDEPLSRWQPLYAKEPGASDE